MPVVDRARQRRELIGEGLRSIARLLDRGAQQQQALDLVAWAKRFCPHHVPLEPSDFHVWIAQQLTECVRTRKMRICAVAPRGNAKSTWISILYPLFLICESLEPYILLVSDSAEQAQGFLEAIKHELEHNEAIATAYPTVAGAGPVWAVKTIVARNLVRVRAVGSQGRVRGLRSREKRPTLILVDDPEGDASTYSALIREKAWNWLTRAMDKVGAADANVVVAGTMLHEECVVGRLQKQAGWRSRTFRAIASWPRRMDLWDEWEKLLRDDEPAAAAFLEANHDAMHEGARVLWPQLEDLVALMRERARGGRAAFLAEKQNEPIPPRAVRFPSEWFEGDELWYAAPPEKALAFCAVDPCVGKRNTEGDLAAVVWCWWLDGDRHLYIDADLERRPPTATNELTVGLHSLHKFTACAYESNGFQGEVAEDLFRRASVAGLFLSVVPVEHQLPKLMRIEKLGPFLERRNFKFRRGSRGSEALVRHLRYFAHPKIEPYDGPDALEMLVDLVRTYAAQIRGGAANLRVAGSVIP